MLYRAFFGLPPFLRIAARNALAGVGTAVVLE
jgi:hypothetical protein